MLSCVFGGVFNIVANISSPAFILTRCALSLRDFSLSALAFRVVSLSLLILIHSLANIAIGSIILLGVLLLVK